MMMLTHRVDTYLFSCPRINQKDIDSSSHQPCNCLLCCQSFDAILLCSNQSFQSKAPHCSVTLINCRCLFANEDEVSGHRSAEAWETLSLLELPTEANEITDRNEPQHWFHTMNWAPKTVVLSCSRFQTSEEILDFKWSRFGWTAVVF